MYANRTRFSVVGGIFKLVPPIEAAQQRATSQSRHTLWLLPWLLSVGYYSYQGGYLESCFTIKVLMTCWY